MKYARIINNQAAIDVRTESPEGFFTPDIAAQFEQVPDTVEDGWIRNGETWDAPTILEPEIQVHVDVIPPAVSPVEFKLLFTSLERVAIKAARSTDPVLEDFYDIVEDPRLTAVNLALQSTQQALYYMQSKGLLTEERVAEILLGRVQ